jgi:hypothetical protein
VRESFHVCIRWLVVLVGLELFLLLGTSQHSGGGCGDVLFFLDLGSSFKFFLQEMIYEGEGHVLLLLVWTTTTAIIVFFAIFHYTMLDA